MIDTQIGIRGDVEIRLYSADDELLHEQEVRNLVTDAGKALLTRKLIGDTEAIQSIGIGSGSTPATGSDTELESEVAEVDVRFQSTENNIASFIATFEENVPSSDTTVREVGLFSDQDLLICRTVLDSSFVKATTDYLVINWKLQIG
jgi:hypothetical protein